MYNIELYL